MKYWLTLTFCWLITLFSQATPKNLYEQLCEVNQEWYKNRSIAQELGFLQKPIIENEQDLLVFHIQTVEKIFRERNLLLSENQRLMRAKHLNVLTEYSKLRDCPRNYYIPQRVPVFVDEDGRYCAVAYLMLKSGKQKFCVAVQKNSNNIYIRQIENQEFSQWQSESGLSIDELAWIQPGYDPWVRIAYWRKKDAQNKLVFIDSLQATKIYNYNFDHTDMFGFGRIFMGMPYDSLKLVKKSKSLKIKPDFSKLNEQIVCAEIYQGELYVGTDSMTYTYVNEDYKYTYRKAVYKWTKAGNWEKVLDLKDENTVYSLFVYGGKLYAGGGNSVYDEKTYRSDYHSYLASFDGKKWQEDKNDYEGYIFGLIYKNKQVYLGIVFNGIDRLISPPIEEEIKPEESQEVENKQ